MASDQLTAQNTPPFDPFSILEIERNHPAAVEIRDYHIFITLNDGRILGLPLGWYPWLAAATPEQQANVEIGLFSIDWPDLEEGIDMAAMLTGTYMMAIEKAAE